MTTNKNARRSFIFLASLALLISLFGIYRAGDRIRLISACTHIMEGVVTNEPARARSKSGSNVEYSYAYDGRNFTADQNIFIRLQKGDIVEIAVNPGQPEESYMTGQIYFGFFWDLFLIALGFGLLWFLRWIRKP
jgi:hypothetical protein